MKCILENQFFHMNVCSSECVFPSYNKIKQQIIDQQSKQYELKIQGLNNRLASMQSSSNFKADHQLIKQSIIALAPSPPPHYNSPFLKEPLRLQSAQKREAKAQSLNYYIEDDEEGENNYQSYLKFKKRALERDLQQEESEEKQCSCKQRKKQRESQQELFRHLFDPQNHKQNTLKINSSKNSRQGSRRATSANIKPQMHYKQVKENAKAFITRLQKGGLRRIGRNSRQQQVKEEMAAFENNKKYLTDNYLDILKKLEGTNIVKWRVLNNQSNA